MADSPDLDTLLPDDEPHATFHDSLIVRWEVDYHDRILVADVAGIPFDRTLVAQARIERLLLVTHDDLIARDDIDTLTT